MAFRQIASASDFSLVRMRQSRLEFEKALKHIKHTPTEAQVISRSFQRTVENATLRLRDALDGNRIRLEL